jgi:hypothetical protein
LNYCEFFPKEKREFVTERMLFSLLL